MFSNEVEKRLEKWVGGSEVQIHLLRAGAKAPEKSTEYATGWDVFASFEPDCNVILKPGETKPIPLGFNISFSPFTWDVQIRSRSGLSMKGLVVANSPGTIDSDYSGLGPDYEVKALITNHSKEPVAITQGMKIAQMIIQEHREEPKLVVVSDVEFITATADRTGGLGSTGVS